MYDTTTPGRPPTRSTNAMVATPHSLASSTGVDVLRDGGSAVDAAIAVNAALAVAYPHMAGIGGDGFWLLAPPGESVRGINASGPAAAAADRAFYGERDDIPERGPAAALTVPGAIDGWRLAHEAYGQLPWERLFRDAIGLAADGVPVTANLARWIRRDWPVLSADDAARTTFGVDGAPPEAGDRLHQPALAASLSTLATEGPREGFYEGDLAASFCGALGDDSPLAPADFASYRAEWVEPLSVSYRGYTAHGLPPNTQGLTALQLLGLLDGFDVEAWGDGTADYYHHMTEATKLAFADRDAWVTDPRSLDVPTDDLLAADYLRERRAGISATATPPGDIEPGIRPAGHEPTDGDPGGDTCYFTVVDEAGLAVSAIQSVYFDFGAGIVAGDTGIVPQNRGAYFSLDPDSVTALEPGKRPFHTLIPAMLTRDREPWLCYGTMGGEGQPQTQAALVTRLVDFGYDVQRAIEAPRWLYGRTWGAESRSLSLEKRVPDGVVTDLEARGHTVSLARGYDETMGHAQAIRCHEDGSLSGGADPRGDGSAIGY
ncbi:gamma-glutamyltransferase [Haloarcula onubensis]|uniref:Gamma-glutamyltransferase n=1 Tax=Haloarcula onubensis TaxID=2950539 RepID=A0ABU2FPR8_9EURY|nr:gamma-glutamyltransferase [Halomicroarcula sp. S3CR25-11]MDS0282750.1 gamma-glutamyltransferase [Halomicroarcula sp. S3CR25-11]